jgi:hypothetical protein
VARQEEGEMMDIDPPVSWEEQKYIDMKRQRDELVEALKIVLSCWVNGREVRDGIPLTALEQARRAMWIGSTTMTDLEKQLLKRATKMKAALEEAIDALERSDPNKGSYTDKLIKRLKKALSPR